MPENPRKMRDHVSCVLFLSLGRETSTGVLANFSRELANFKRELAKLKRELAKLKRPELVEFKREFSRFQANETRA